MSRKKLSMSYLLGRQFLRAGLFACALWLVFSTINSPIGASAQGTQFTFHGQLTDSGSPANGAYDLEFQLFDQVSGGTQQGSVNAFDDQDIANGLFAVKLDFGSDVFDGSQRWLEIAVRPGASTGAF